jgi:hypothetical protein
MDTNLIIEEIPDEFALQEEDEFPLTEDTTSDVILLARIEMVKRYAAAKDILGWGKLLFPEKFTLPFCTKLHQHFVDVRSEEYVCDEAPRGHAKTAIKCFLIPIFQALEEPQTFQHYLNVQSTGTKAMSINVSIKEELETNELIYRIYGNQIGRRWTDQQFVTKAGVIFTAIGAGQSLRGINYRNTRPDYIIVDDLYDEEDINNPESTLKKNQWFWGSLYYARAKSRRCSIHVQGTAINDEDILEKLKHQDRWKCQTFQAIENYETPAAQVLWPELNSLSELEKDKADSGSVIFMREMQNVRRDDATSIIKKKYLDYYEPLELHEKLRVGSEVSLIGITLGVDPSIGKDKTETDFTGVALILKTRYTDSEATEYYIENVWNEKLSLNERILLLLKIRDQQPSNRSITDVRIESISGFQDFTAEVIRRTSLPVTEVDKVPDKITNRENKSKFFENKRVHINKNIDPILMDVLVYQLTHNYPKHDDVCDAVLLGLTDDPGYSWI